MTERFASTRAAASLLTVVVLGLAAASPASATVVSSGQSGGGGGTAFTQTCPDGGVLNGIRGRAAGLIDAVGAICVRLDALRDAFSESTPATTGGSGGTAFELRCPQGWAVVGIKGRAASLVDRLQLVCAPMVAGGTAQVVNETTDPFKVGGNGGSSFTRHCSGVTPARGINGGAASFVDRIGLGCENATFVAVAANNATRPDFRGVIRDLPFKVVRGTSVRYTTELWNVGGVEAPAGSSMDLFTDFPIAFPTIEFNFQTCDFNRPPPIRGHYMRCRTVRPTPPLTTVLGLNVTFTADAAPNSYRFAGLPNQDGAIATAQLATSRFRRMRVVENVGRFTLTPRKATVAVHQRFNYTVAWTVPKPLTWKRLKTVRLVIADGETSVLSVQLDRAAGTLGLRDRAGGRSGRALRLGHDGTLSNRFATVDVGDSSMRGNGPTGRKVTLKLALSFKRRPAARPLRVEVLATGPPGFEQVGSELAGTLRVRR
jgi:hypothetical protein